MRIFCRDCQAVPSNGYCRLSGCPMPKPEPDVVVYGDERDELLALIREKYPEATGLPECPPEDMTKGSVQDDSRLQAEIDRTTMSTNRIWKDGEWIYFGSEAARDGFEAGECMAWATEQSCPYGRTSKEWKEWIFAFRKARGIR